MTCHAVRATNGLRLGAVEHVVAVVALGRVEAGVELRVVGPRDVADGDVRAAHAVDAPLQVGQIDVVGQVEADDLAPAVHAGVGATGADQVDRRRTTRSMAARSSPITVRTPSLLGEAGEFGAVVGHRESSSPHHAGAAYGHAAGASASAGGRGWPRPATPRPS